jgi:prepilin peptidase CpaA
MVGGVAIVIDNRSHRIPNTLVVFTLIAALVIHLWSDGPAGARSALVGSLIGLGFLLPLYMSGAMGGGDVKFMAAMGALLGPAGALLAGAVTLVAGALLALGAVAWQRRMTVPEAGAASALSIRLPYAAAIVTGALTATLIAA